MSEASATPRHSTRLFGHSSAVHHVLRMWSQDRLPHALLLTGPRGVGKATFAHHLARFLLANGAGEAEAGGLDLLGDPVLPQTFGHGVSEDLRHRIAHGGHGGLHVLERQAAERTGKLRAAITVDQVREGLLRFLTQTATEGHVKVAIVDAADELNPSAANALLKMLEEPPGAAVMILACHEPGRLLPTIRSRCVRVALGPLDEATMSDALHALAPAVASEARDQAAALAGGRPGLALELLNPTVNGLVAELTALLQAPPPLRDVQALANRVADDPELAARFWSTLLTVLAAHVRGQARVGVEHPAHLWEKLHVQARQADGLTLDPKHVMLSALLEIRATVSGALSA